MTLTHELRSIADAELLRRLHELTRQSRRVESDLVAHISEVDERRLYASHACSSMFTFCTEVLHLSEAEAYLRIAAARASRKYPMLLAMLGDGRIHLSGIGKLAPHLTEANYEVVLARASHKSKREIEELIAELAPKPDVLPAIRKLRIAWKRLRPRHPPLNSVRTLLKMKCRLRSLPHRRHQARRRHVPLSSLSLRRGTKSLSRRVRSSVTSSSLFSRSWKATWRPSSKRR